MIDKQKSLQIIGGSGHAKVVIQTARAAGYEPVAVYDDNPVLHGKMLCGVPVKGAIADAQNNGFLCIIAIGDNIISIPRSVTTIA